MDTSKCLAANFQVNAVYPTLLIFLVMILQKSWRTRIPLQLNESSFDGDYFCAGVGSTIFFRRGWFCTVSCYLRCLFQIVYVILCELCHTYGRRRCPWRVAAATELSTILCRSFRQLACQGILGSHLRLSSADYCTLDELCICMIRHSINCRVTVWGFVWLRQSRLYVICHVMAFQ